MRPLLIALAFWIGAAAHADLRELAPDCGDTITGQAPREPAHFHVGDRLLSLQWDAQGEPTRLVIGSERISGTDLDLERHAGQYNVSTSRSVNAWTLERRERLGLLSERATYVGKAVETGAEVRLTVTLDGHGHVKLVEVASGEESLLLASGRQLREGRAGFHWHGQHRLPYELSRDLVWVLWRFANYWESPADVDLRNAIRFTLGDARIHAGVTPAQLVEVIHLFATIENSGYRGRMRHPDLPQTRAFLAWVLENASWDLSDLPEIQALAADLP